MLLEDLWQARKCCWEVRGIELLVVIWISGRQACWLAWVNLSLRSLFSAFLFSSPFFVITSSVGEPWFFIKIGLLPWSGHCLIPALGI